MSRFRAITPARRHALQVAVGAGIAVAVLWGAPSVKAAENLPYDFGTGLTFSYKKGGTGGNATTGGTLTGSFTLDCGYAASTEDCVTYDGGTVDLINGEVYDGWTYFGDGGYLYQDLTNISVSWTYAGNTVVATSALYGYTLDGAYFLQFYYLPPGSNGNQGEYVTLYLNDDEPGNTTFSDPLPYVPQANVPVTGSVVTEDRTLTSNICQNAVPPPAAINCPQGQIYTLSAFDGDVINRVPAPFGVVLLLPAVLMARLRCRYAGQISR